MKFKELEIYEARMGASDLANVNMSGLTFGFEFEVAVDDSLVRDYRPELSPLSFEEWSEENYYETYHSVEESRLDEFLDIDQIRPKYGFAYYEAADIGDGFEIVDEAIDITDEVLAYYSNRYYDETPEEDYYEKINRFIQLFGMTSSLSLWGARVKNFLRGIENKEDILGNFIRLLEIMFDIYASDHRIHINSYVFVYGDDNKKTIVPYKLSKLEIFDEGLFVNEQDETITRYEDIPALVDAIEMEKMSAYQEYTDNYDYSSKGLSGIIEIVADILDNELNDGREINVSHTYHARKKSGNIWTVEPDGSIEPQGAEIVSPIFHTWDEAEKNLRTVLQVIDENFMTNSTTGLHVNIGTFNSDDIDLLKLFLFTGQSYVLDAVKRSKNDYATNSLKLLVDYLENNKTKKPSIEELNEIIMTIQKSNGRHQFFNLSHLDEDKGYIEIRALGNRGYERDPDRIVKFIQRFARAIKIAMDPAAYRNEYLKKIYTVIDKTKDVSKVGTNKFQNVVTLIKTLNKKLGTSISTNIQFREQFVIALIDDFITSKHSKEFKTVVPYLPDIRKVYESLPSHPLYWEDRVKTYMRDLSKETSPIARQWYTFFKNLISK